MQFWADRQTFGQIFGVGVRWRCRLLLQHWGNFSFDPVVCFKERDGLGVVSHEDLISHQCRRLKTSLGMVSVNVVWANRWESYHYVWLFKIYLFICVFVGSFQTDSFIGWKMIFWLQGWGPDCSVHLKKEGSLILVKYVRGFCFGCHGENLIDNSFN